MRIAEERGGVGDPACTAEYPELCGQRGVERAGPVRHQDGPAADPQLALRWTGGWVSRPGLPSPGLHLKCEKRSRANLYSDLNAALCGASFYLTLLTLFKEGKVAWEKSLFAI